MLDLAVELLALLFELLFSQLRLLLQVFEIVFSFVPRTVSLPSKFNGFLYVFLFGLKFLLQLSVDVLHGILFLAKLVDLFPQFVVIG